MRTDRSGTIRARLRQGSLVAALVPALLAISTMIVYWSGGTAYAWPYVILVPVLLAAAWFHIPGGVLTGLVAGLLLGPYMPLEVATGEAQSLDNWLTRLVAYMGLGGFAGGLFLRLERATERQHRIARSDVETGLPNQAALHEDLGAGQANMAGRFYDHGTAIVLVRATDLAEAQEAIGTDATEHIVPILAERFRREEPRVTAVYRFSNSELALRIEGVDDDGLGAVMARLQAAAEDHIPVRGIPIRLELVAGAARADADWVDAQTLIRRARMALFAAIEHDRSYQIYDPRLDRGATESVRMMARLRTALERGELLVHYQPKVHLASATPWGCEGLIRWHDPDSGLVPPGKFMPKVESTSLIKPVTAFVTRSACDFAAAGSVARPVSINFSVRNLFDPEMLAELEQLLTDHGLRADELEIEITEGALIRNPAEAVRLIHQVREIGVRVSIDDFGTGYSSFEYLRRLPVTGLKIDRAFIAGVEADRQARDLLGCMIDAGHALGLEVTAEGIETDGQYRILRELHCDIGQGFLFARAMPPNNFLEWMREPPSTLEIASAD